MFGEYGGRISCDAKEGGVTEGQKPCIANEKIQTHDEQSENENLRKQAYIRQVYENRQRYKEQYNDRCREQGEIHALYVLEIGPWLKFLLTSQFSAQESGRPGHQDEYQDQIHRVLCDGREIDPAKGIDDSY